MNNSHIHKREIAIISHSDSKFRTIRDLSFKNHEAYCLKHGYTYIKDTSDADSDPKYSDRDSRWKKIELLRHNLSSFDWVLWIDSDAFFVNKEIRIESIITACTSDSTSFIFSKSPAVQNAPYINSGVFLVRNSAYARDFLDEVWNAGVIPADIYNEEENGFSCYGGDQNTLVYLLKNKYKNSIGKEIQVVEGLLFNARAQDFETNKDLFIVHFPGDNKEERIGTFFKMAC